MMAQVGTQIGNKNKNLFYKSMLVVTGEFLDDRD